MENLERHQEAVQRLQAMTLLPPEQVGELYEQAAAELLRAQGKASPDLPLAVLVFARALELVVAEEKKTSGGLVS